MSTRGPRAPPASSVLVTGASGFLGSHLVRRLAEEGVTVHATSRTERGPDEGGVRWRQVELSDLEAVRDLFRATEPHTVFNLAGFATGAPDIELIAPTYDSNLTATVNVLSAAAETGCSRIFLTKSLTEPDGVDSDSPAGSPYAVSKWAASGYARMFHALYGLPVVSLRIFMAYGPAQPDLSKLVPHVTVSLLRGNAPELSSGQLEMDWVYVDDVIDGCLAAAGAEGIEGQTLDIGTGRLFSVRDVVERLTELTGARTQPGFGSLPDRPREITRVADADGASAAIGWRARVGLDEGLRQTVAWYRDQIESGAL